MMLIDNDIVLDWLIVWSDIDVEFELTVVAGARHYE
jgi:hypothetical protein